MTDISIHHATNITTAGVQYENKNAITLTVSTGGFYGNLPHKITIFGLPTHTAHCLEYLFGKGGVKPSMTEAEIRADERRKIASQIDPAF
jgi:hypothetical protein